MKSKRKLAFIWVLALLAVLTVARYSLFTTAWSFNTATLHYEINGIPTETVLADEDWDTIASALNFKLMEKNIYRCPIGKELYISVDNGTDFYIAKDGCFLINVSDGSRCISLEGEDALSVKSILLKYGVDFPVTP